NGAPPHGKQLSIASDRRQTLSTRRRSAKDFAIMHSSSKVAIVTGAGTGIGKAVATAMLKDGYKVVLAGRRSEPLEKAIADSGAPKGSALAVPTDVSDPASVA